MEVLEHQRLVGREARQLPPAEKVFSWVLASTTQRTASSSRAAAKAASMSSSSWSDSALRVSGWSIAIVATPSATS